MWADKNWYKVNKKNLKEGFGYWDAWTYKGTSFYDSPFNPHMGGEPRTDDKGQDVIGVRITIEEL